MAVKSGHIISSCKWETSFDNKDEAVELQSKLSSFTKFSLPREVSSIFDRICPPDQTWRINTLELDLGIIDYDDLNSDLSLKLYQQLNEKLIDMVLYSSKTDENIEIIESKGSNLSILKEFLLNGLLPWWYKSSDGNISQVMNYQLQENKQLVSKLLRDLGKAEVIRKRIAWQFSYPVVMRIITAVEPNNHEQIINYSEQVILVQEKEMMIKTDLSNFKKNLVLGILNYVFVERGTLFNKIDFMKSTIKQMSSHYNIKQETLLELIAVSVANISKKGILKQEFLLVLRSITDEFEANKNNKTNQVQSPIDYWLVLESFFISGKSDLFKSQLNELIHVLAQKDSHRLKVLVKTWYASVGNRKRVFATLDQSGQEAFLRVLAPHQFGFIAKSITYFGNVIAKQPFNKKDKTLIFGLSISYLINQQGTAFDDIKFLEHLVDSLSIKLTQSKKVLLNSLTDDEYWGLQSSLFSADLQFNLKSLLIKEVTTQQGTTYVVKEYEVLLKLLDNLIFENKRDSESINLIQLRFRKFFQLNPQAVLEYISSRTNNKNIDHILPYIFDDYNLDFLFQYAEKKVNAPILKIQHIIKELSDNRDFASVVSVFNQNYKWIALDALLQVPNWDSKQLFQFIINAFSDLVSSNALQQFKLFMSALTQHEKLVSYGLTEYNNNIQKQSLLMPDNSIQKALKVISHSLYRQDEVSRILAKDLSKNINILITAPNTFTKTIIDYLFHNGLELKTSVVKEYMKFFEENKQVSSRALESELTILFLTCIIDFKAHYGKKDNLLAIFKSAVIAKYGLNDNHIRNTLINSFLPSQSVINYEVSKGVFLAESDLIIILKEHLEKGSFSIPMGNYKVDLRNVFNTLLETAPDRLRIILAGLPNSNAFVQILRKILSFDRFSSFIAADLNDDLQKLMIDLRLLIRIIHSIVSNHKIHNLIENKLWVSTLNEIKSRGSHAHSLEILVDFSFDILSDLPEVNSEIVRNELRKNESLMSSSFKAVLLQKKLILNSESDLVNIEKQDLLTKPSLGQVSIEELCKLIIINGQIPSWYTVSTIKSGTVFLTEIVKNQPVVLLKVLKYQSFQENHILQLSHKISFSDLVNAIISIDYARKNLLLQMESLYKNLNSISISGISHTTIQSILFRKVILAWCSGNWKPISDKQIWNELLWDISVKNHINKSEILTGFEKIKNSLPLSLQVSLNNILDQNNYRNKPHQDTLGEIEDISILLKPKLNHSIKVRNAGLVLVNSYLLSLFNRLELLENGIFKDSFLQQDAIHFLQFFATGQTHTDEPFLLLNKILCGIHPQCPIIDGIHISKLHKETIEGLITAMIGHWSSIGTCSIDGFRGNWIIRDGLLTEHEDKWELIIEKRAYDLLLNHSPFSYSMIKYPWMEKPLQVIWNY